MTPLVFVTQVQATFGIVIVTADPHVKAWGFGFCRIISVVEQHTSIVSDILTIYSQIAQLAEQRTVNPRGIINSMKICSMCKEKKDFSLFNKKGANRTQPYCKTCDNKKSRERYAENRQEHSKKVYERNKKVRKELSLYIKDIKEKTPCTDCKKYYPSYVMDFDHVIGLKINNISVLVNQLAKNILIEELKKCEVVCANCHRERTFNKRKEKG